MFYSQLVLQWVRNLLALHYAYLNVGSLEETFMFPQILHLHFKLTEYMLIEEYLKVSWIYFCFMTKNANNDVFREILNIIHPSQKFTLEKEKYRCEQNFNNLVQVFKLLRYFYYYTPKWSVRN